MKKLKNYKDRKRDNGTFEKLENVRKKNLEEL